MLNSKTEHWQFVNLSEVLISLESGSRPKGGVKNIKSGIPSIGAEHLNTEGGFNFNNIKYIPTAFAERMQRGKILLNDILIVKDGATTARVSFVKKDFPFSEAYVNEHVFICRPSKSINSKFLFWFLWSDQGRANILQNFKGSAQGGINTTFIDNCIVPIPPIEEQNKIVLKLDNLFNNLQNVQKLLSLMPDLIANANQKILTAAVTGDLTKKWRAAQNSPKDWDTFSLDTFISSIDSGKSVKCFERPPQIDEVGIVKVSSVSWGEFLENESKTITHSKFINEKYFINTGDFLMSRANTTELVGACVIVKKITKRLMLSDKILRLKFSGINKEWVLLYLRSSEGRGQIEEMASGSQQHMKNISQEKIKKILIALPPNSEQQTVVEITTRLFAKIAQIKDKADKLKGVLNVSQRQLLSSAFEGKLISGNQEDNSVLTLIENIRIEKETYKQEQSNLRNMTKTKRPSKSANSSKNLSSILKNELKSDSFSFTDIKKYFNFSDYDFLRDDLVKLIKEDKLKMEYNENSQTFTFNIKS